MPSSRESSSAVAQTRPPWVAWLGRSDYLAALAIFSEMDAKEEVPEITEGL